MTRNYFLMLLMGALITSFGNWVSKSVPSPQDPPPPAGPAKVKFANQVLKDPPDGKLFVVRIYGDPKRIAIDVKFCVEALPEVESLGIPSYDNSYVEINNVMHVERERVTLTADCFKIGRLDKDQTLTIRYPAKIKQSPARSSPTLKLRNSGNGYSFDEVLGARSTLDRMNRRPSAGASDSTLARSATISLAGTQALRGGPSGVRPDEAKQKRENLAGIKREPQEQRFSSATTSVTSVANGAALAVGSSASARLGGIIMKNSDAQGTLTATTMATNSAALAIGTGTPASIGGISAAESHLNGTAASTTAIITSDPPTSDIVMNGRVTDTVAGMSGVTVSVTVATSATATTGADGSYVFTGLQLPTVSGVHDGYCSGAAGECGLHNAYMNGDIAPNQFAQDLGKTGDGRLTGFSVGDNTCTYAVSSASQEFSVSGGAVVVNVTISGDCAWAASGSSPSWVTITGTASEDRNGQVTYDVAANGSGATGLGSIFLSGSQPLAYSIYFENVPLAAAPAQTVVATDPFHSSVSTNAFDQIVRYSYDETGNLTTVTGANGPISIFVYDTLDRLTMRTQRHGLSATTTCTYDAAGNRLTKSTMDPDPVVYSYDGNGNKTSETDALGRTTTYQYDALNPLISTYPTSPTTSITTTYDFRGDAIIVTDRAGNVTHNSYDLAGKLISCTSGYGTSSASTTSYTYYADGRRNTQTDPLGNITTYNYDPEGRLTSTVDAAGNITAYGYDAANNRTSVTYPKQNTTQFAYDARHLPQTTTYPDTTTKGFTYDGANNLSSVTDQAGAVVQYTYDNADQLTSLFDSNGKTTSYGYDSLNRLLSITPDPASGDATVSFTYTPPAQRATMTDASGTTMYSYDSLDRLTSKATPQGTLTYTYDAASSVASIASSNANGTNVSYTYDSLNRLSTVVDNRLPSGHSTTTYTYDPNSNVATATYPNGLQSTFTYDALNRLKAPSGYSYQLGPTRNRASATEASGRTLNWTYDGIYRLTNEAIASDPDSNNGSVAYGLDPVGNRLSVTSTLPNIFSGHFNFNADDRLSTETYDNNASVLTSNGYSFQYDFANRLKSANGGATTLVYDGDGSSVSKTFGGLTTQYIVDDLNSTCLPRVVEEVLNDAAQCTYTYGLQGISENQLISGAWTASFYGYDGGGHVRVLNNAAGAIADTYDYDALGNVVSKIDQARNRIQFAYDQIGRLISTTFSSYTTESVYDAPDWLAPETQTQLIAPTLAAVSPTLRAAGQPLSVTIASHNTHFNHGPTQVSFGSGISVGLPPEANVGSATTAIATLINEPRGADASIYYFGARWFDPSSSRWIATDDDESLTRVRPLQVKMLDSGRTHLTVTSEVEPVAGYQDPYEQERLEPDIPLRPLRVRMLDSGAAQLTVSSEVEPVAGYPPARYQEGREPDIHVRPLRVRMPDRGGAHLIVENRVANRKALRVEPQSRWIDATRCYVGKALMILLSFRM